MTSKDALLPHKPNALQGALLVLALVDSKEREIGKSVTRFRVSQVTLSRLFCRKRISLDYLHEVEEWLLAAGWALFFAGSTYAMIRVSAVEGWNRLASKRIESELDQVARGTFNFTKFTPLLINLDEAANANDDE